MEAPKKTRTNYRGTILFSLGVFLLLFAGVGSWMVYANIAGAVVATGTVIVKGKPKSIQHLDGGIVREILVESGQLIAKGDVLIRLDDTLIKANYEIYRNRLREALARMARLTAERDGAETIDWDTEFSAAVDLGDVNQHRLGQQKLFDARRATRLGQKSQLRKKIEQFNNQIEGVEGLLSAKQEQVQFVEKELNGAKILNKKGLTPLNRILALQRQRSDLLGQLAEHNAEIAGIENSIHETEISISQIDREFQEKVLSELREVTAHVSEMVQQILATKEQLGRIDVTAPVSGIVHELNVFTIGGVVPPGGTVMQLIAQNEGVEVEMNVEPQYIDQVAIGREAAVRFPAFNQRTTPEIYGSISLISPSSVVDEKNRSRILSRRY